MLVAEQWFVSTRSTTYDKASYEDQDLITYTVAELSPLRLNEASVAEG
jgi:hypothetical protein